MAPEETPAFGSRGLTRPRIRLAGGLSARVGPFDVGVGRGSLVGGWAFFFAHGTSLGRRADATRAATDKNIRFSVSRSVSRRKSHQTSLSKLSVLSGLTVGRVREQSGTMSV